MTVLVACEFSGTVRDAFIRRGHHAVSCDLLPSESDYGPHIQADVRDVDLSTVDLLIAHPPCTYITNAGVRHLHDHVTSRNGNHTSVYGAARWQAMYDACDFFNFLLKANVPKICVENPIPHGYAKELIGAYSTLIHPWQFGHPVTKATCLWLKNLPKLRPTKINPRRVPYVHMLSPSPDRWKRRSRTFTGIARAMAEQWG